MHTPGVTLKLRKFRRRFGIAAPKVVVRTHLPWQWLAVPAVLLLLLVGVAGWLIAQRNEAGAMALEIDRLHRESQSQLEELKTHRLAAGAEFGGWRLKTPRSERMFSYMIGSFP